LLRQIGDAGVAANLSPELSELHIVSPRGELSPQAAQDDGCHLRPVRDSLAQQPRFEHQIEGVHQRALVAGRQQQTEHPFLSRVLHDDGPLTIDDEGGVRLVHPQQKFQGAPRFVEVDIIERACAEPGREAGAEEEVVVGPQGELQRLGQTSHHLAARLRPARFEKGKMAG